MTTHEYLYDMAKRLVSARLDDALLREARRSLGARSESDALRLALELAKEVEQTRRFLKRWGGKGGRSAFPSL